MPKISSKDTTIHYAQYLIHALKNPAPNIPLVTLVNDHKEELVSLAYIFGKSTSPESPPRIPIEEAYPEKLQQVNKAKNPIRKYYQVKHPITYVEPPRVPIEEEYPDKTQMANPEKNNKKLDQVKFQRVHPLTGKG